MPIVSIIIPIYNVKEKYLRKCIESAIDQTLKEIEIILIDDGSQDKCGEICDEYADKDGRIKVIHKENGGVSSARNRGLEQAVGEYIMFVDADDYMELDATRTCVGFREKYSADFLCFGYYQDEKPEKGFSFVKFLTPKEAAKVVAAYKGNAIKGYLWNKFFSSKIIRKNHLIFDDTVAFCEDALFCQQYVKYCHKIVCIPDPLYHYISNDNSFTHKKISQKTCTVFAAYRKIIDVCKDYQDKDLNELLWGNYYTHYILNLKRVKNELTLSERKEFWYIYEFVKANKRKILGNRYVKVKRKILTIYLLFAFWKDEKNSHSNNR